MNAGHDARAPTQYELFADGPHDGTEAYEVGDPRMGEEVTRLAGLRFQLATNLRDVHPQVVRFGAVFGAPDALQQCLLGATKKPLFRGAEVGSGERVR